MPLSKDDIKAIRDRVVLSINNAGIVTAVNPSSEGAQRINITMYETLNRHQLTELAVKLASLPAHIELAMARAYNFIGLEFFSTLDEVPEFPQYKFVRYPFL